MTCHAERNRQILQGLQGARREGDGPRVRRIEEQLVLANEGLARRFVCRYAGRPAVERDDLMQEARLGILRASRSWDPDRGITFSTYAWFWVRRYLQVLDRSIRPLPQEPVPDGGCRFITQQPDRPYVNAPRDVSRLLSFLAPRMRRLICLHFGIGCAQHNGPAIGRCLGIGRHRVAQLLEVALAQVQQLARQLNLHPVAEEARSAG